MKNIYLIFLLLYCVTGCGILQPRAVSVSESDVINNENLVEVSQDTYFEFIGLKKYSARQIVDSMQAKQTKTLSGNNALHACSSIMKKNLGFEYVSPKYVNPNYSFITVVESKKEYGITEKEWPPDSLETNTEWNIEHKTLHNFSNKMALSFFLQFIRTDGNKLSMKMKLLYNQFASDADKKFSEGLLAHLNSLDLNKELPLARKTLLSDGNRVNRYWALLIMMRTKPTDDDLALIFDQFNYNDPSLKTYSTYVLRETLKLRDEIDWKRYNDDLRNIISGASVENYDQLLKILSNDYSNSKNSHSVLNPHSPLLKDYLNAYREEMSKLAFNFIQQISPEKIENKEEANEWLASQYQIIHAMND
ncbi:MAG: hypothetical protein RI564_00010 [Gracilimonas sp.]|nr:hypothetical protein [Gracilimonas sp.]